MSLNGFLPPRRAKIEKKFEGYLITALLHKINKTTKGHKGGPFQKALGYAGITSSMSRKGDCWDNAVAESFFATIKRELIDTVAWFSHQSLRAAIYEYIEVFYNRKRRHSANNYLAPVEYENRCLEQLGMVA